MSRSSLASIAAELEAAGERLAELGPLEPAERLELAGDLRTLAGQLSTRDPRALGTAEAASALRAIAERLEGAAELER